MENKNSNKQSFILIDAYSQIFRAFFAIAHLSRKDGFPTNALFGFARFLMQLEKEYSPEGGAMFFDCGKPAFRLELLPEYKSNRPPMPDNLKKQMPLLRKLAELFGWQVCECSNYEADDLIGAAVKSFPEHEFGIVSSDKDLSQLIDEHCFMLIPSRSGSGFEKRSTEETFQKFSVMPAQIIEYLALIGDSSDAIDGVEGIGPKTAAKILEDCGSLDGFFADPEKVANKKLRDKLLLNRDKIMRNTELVKLRCCWPADEIGPADKWLEKNKPNWQAIYEFALEYELKSIIKDLPEDAKISEKESPAAAKEVPQTPKECNIPENGSGDDEYKYDLFGWGVRFNNEKTEKSVSSECSDDAQQRLF